MIGTLENLILDLLEWVGSKERTYQDTLDAWRTSCPRFPVWEDANDRGLVETACRDGQSLVRVTAAGLALLEELRPRAYEKRLASRARNSAAASFPSKQGFNS